MIVAIAAGGAAAGCLLGIASGRAMVDLYLVYYKFPFLVFQLDPASFVTGFLVSVGSASAGGLLVLRRVFALTRLRAAEPAGRDRGGAGARRVGRAAPRAEEPPWRHHWSGELAAPEPRRR